MGHWSVLLFLAAICFHKCTKFNVNPFSWCWDILVGLLCAQLKISYTNLKKDHGVRAVTPDEFVMDDAEARLVLCVSATLLSTSQIYSGAHLGFFGREKKKNHPLIYHTEGTLCQHTMTNRPKMPLPTLSNWITGTSTSFTHTHTPVVFKSSQ